MLLASAVFLVWLLGALRNGEPTAAELSEHPFLDGPPESTEVRREELEAGFFGWHPLGGGGPSVTILWASRRSPEELVAYYRDAGLREAGGSDVLTTRLTRSDDLDGIQVQLSAAVQNDARSPRAGDDPPPGTRGFVWTYVGTNS